MGGRAREELPNRREDPPRREVDRERKLEVSSLKMRDGIMVVAYLVTLGAAWGIMDASLESLEARVDRFETRIDVRFSRLEGRLDRVLENQGER